MTEEEKKALMDSLTESQREGIAKIIREQEVCDTYVRDSDGGSICVEDAYGTLNALANYFEYYDPTSIHE